MEPYLVTLTEESEVFPLFQHPGSEFVYVLEGELVLITDTGEQVMTPGMVAGFPAGAENGHHLVNRSDRDALYLEIGDRQDGDEVDYPDIDMQVKWIDGGRRYVHKDGTPY